MSGVVPVSLSRGVHHLSFTVIVWFNIKYTYNNTRSQHYAGDPDPSIMQLVVCLIYLYFLSAWFCCCWCGSLFQLPITYIFKRSRTLPLFSICAWLLMSLSIASLCLIISSKELMNYLSVFIPYISHTCEYFPQ